MKDARSGPAAWAQAWAREPARAASRAAPAAAGELKCFPSLRKLCALLEKSLFVYFSLALPRKAPLQTVTRARNNAPAKRQANRIDATVRTRKDGKLLHRSELTKFAECCIISIYLQFVGDFFSARRD